MLPSKGFFSNSLCPSYSRRECSRPYCHYRHSRGTWDQTEKNDEFIKNAIENKVKEISNKDVHGQVMMDTVINSIMKEIKNQVHFEQNVNMVPSYNPTPISELNRRQISVSLPAPKPSYSTMVRNKHIGEQRKCDDKTDGIYEEIISTSTVTEMGDSREVYSVSGEGVFHSPNVNINTETESVSAQDLGVFSTSLGKTSENSDIPERGTNLVIHERTFPEPLNVLNKCDQSSRFLGSSFSMATENCEMSAPSNDCTLEIKENCLNSENRMENSTEIDKTHNRKQKKQFRSSKKQDKKKFKKHLSETEDLNTTEKRKELSSKPVKVQEDLNLNVHTHNNNKETSESYEPIVLSSESNSPSSEDDKNSVIFSCQDSPPLKRKKDSSAESLCERWRRAREMIDTRKRSNGNLKIKPVANVEVLLKGRGHVEMKGNQENSIKICDEKYENFVPRKIVRKSRVPLETVKQYPNIIMEDNLQIPFYIRQNAIKSLFDEFCKFKESAEAYEDSQKLEIELCRRVRIIKTYTNAIAVAVLRIRKQKGSVFDKETPKEVLRSNTIPSFTNGWTLYKCFSEYLLSFEQYKRNGYPMPIPSKRGCAFIEKSARRTKSKKPSDKHEQTCDHCSRTYRVDRNGLPLKEYDCFYHWGKLRRLRVCGGFVERYTCCSGDTESEPCTNGRYHVCNLFNEDLLEGFVTTRPLREGESLHTAGIYGIDCEMCYTTKGIELTRCTLVDLNGRTVYDKIVVPENPIIDYCTRFSGITEAIIKTSALRLSDIQNDLLYMINDKTILVGHSLENDLKVLRMFHNTLVDTSVIFPHKNGLPLKQSLKKIAKDLLNLTIQENENGHDSYEDANACVQIMLWKIKEDAKKRKPRIIISLESNN